MTIDDMLAQYRRLIDRLSSRLAAKTAALEVANGEIERLKAEQGYDRQATLQAALEAANEKLANCPTIDDVVAVQCPNSLEAGNKRLALALDLARTELSKWKDRADGWEKNHHDELKLRVRLEAELADMRKEVREWICLECRCIYPGPPQEGVKCVICPRCGGVTVKHGGDSPWRFRAERAEARAKELERRLQEKL